MEKNIHSTKNYFVKIKIKYIDNRGKLKFKQHIY